MFERCNEQPVDKLNNSHSSQPSSSALKLLKRALSASSVHHPLCLYDISELTHQVPFSYKQTGTFALQPRTKQQDQAQGSSQVDPGLELPSVGAEGSSCLCRFSLMQVRVLQSHISACSWTC